METVEQPKVKKKRFGPKSIACQVRIPTSIPKDVGEKRILPKRKTVMVTKKELVYLRDRAKTLIGNK
jgi:hypothetical protein